MPRKPPSSDPIVQARRDRARAKYFENHEANKARSRANNVRGRAEHHEKWKLAHRAAAAANRADPVKRAVINARARAHNLRVSLDPVRLAKRRAYQRDWYARNADKFRVYCRNRYAALAGAPGKHTAAEVLARLDEQCGLCAYCLAPMPTGFEVEHVIPISRGGSNDIGNIVCACGGCNNAKNDRTILEFLQYRERRAA